jgi:hypothetical protein
VTPTGGKMHPEGCHIQRPYSAGVHVWEMLDKRSGNEGTRILRLQEAVEGNQRLAAYSQPWVLWECGIRGWPMRSTLR